jgi:hypothetical protein
VYFPGLTPSNFSSSDWSTHFGLSKEFGKGNGEEIEETQGETGRSNSGNAYNVWDIDFDGLDANILRCHSEEVKASILDAKAEVGVANCKNLLEFEGDGSNKYSVSISTHERLPSVAEGCLRW